MLLLAGRDGLNSQYVQGLQNVLLLVECICFFKMHLDVNTVWSGFAALITCFDIDTLMVSTDDLATE